MGEVGTSLTFALAAARHDSMGVELTDAAPADGLTTPCRVLGELLGLDATWILAGDGLRPAVLARWSRDGVRPHRLGAARLASILADCPHGCTGWRDGRYAVIVAPVEAAGERLGTLVGSVRSAHEFGPAELAAAELIAAGAAAAIATPVAPAPPRPNGAAMRPLEHLEMLHSLSLRLARARSEQEAGRAVVTELTTLIDHHACRFYLLSADGTAVVPVAHDGVIAEYEDDRTADLVCRVGEGVAGSAVVDGRARRIPDAAADSYAVDVPGSEPIDESMMVAPMLIGGEPIGAIVLSKLGLDEFDDTDLHVLEVVAGKAAAACENVRLYASMRDAAEISEALIELGAALALQGSVDAVAEMLARAVDRLVESAAISVWLRAGDQMTLAAHVGYTPVEVQRLAAAAGGGDRGAVCGQPRLARARGVHAQAGGRASCATWRRWRRGRPSRSCPSASGRPTGRRSSSSAASAAARPTAATSRCCSGSPTRRSWRWSTAACTPSSRSRSWRRSPRSAPPSGRRTSTRATTPRRSSA